MSGINHLAVVAGAAAAFAINFVWFTVLFRAPYIAGLGKTREQMDAGPSAAVAMTLQVIGFLAMGYVLAWLVARTGHQGVTGALTVGALAWAGFVAAALVPMFAFQAFPYSFSAITAGGYLVGILAIAAIVGAWK